MLVVHDHLQCSDPFGVQFLVHEQFLDLFADVPQSDLSVAAPADDPRAVRTGGDRSDFPVLVRLVDDVREFARLRQECADLAVAPPADDALAVRHEVDREALVRSRVLPRQLNPQQFPLTVRVPQPDLAPGARGEHFRVTSREDDVPNQRGVTAREGLLSRQAV